MDPEQRRQGITNYFLYYYNQLRKELPSYTADPESVPHFLRGHDRRIQIWECRDGYALLHYPDPENVHNAPTPERFELVTNYQHETVGELMSQDIPPGTLPSSAPFWATHMPYAKNETRQEYVMLKPWERRDLISNIRIQQWTADRVIAQTGQAGIEEANEQLRDFFNGSPSY